MMESVTTESFREKIYFDDERSVVLFTAPWCGFCRSMKLMIQKAEKDFGTTKFYTVDIDEEPSLKTSFAIAAVPTLILFEEGRPLNRITGLIKKSDLYEFLDLKAVAD